MNNIELLKELVRRLKKYSWLILLVALLFGGLFFFIARQGVVQWTSTATVFPLNSTNPSSTGSAISNLLGLTDAPKSFTEDASINIVELATSRRTREAVAMERIPSLQNKTVSELLIEENNRYTGFMQNEKIETPPDSLTKVNIASNLLRLSFSAKINKNGILELHYTNSNRQLVREVSYIYIEKLSQFYIELKKKKAQIDYEFSIKKADSLLAVLNQLDKRAIALDESTFFTNEGLQRYSIPKVNLAQDKSTVQSQYYYAVNNRESAAYRLQKETPIIEALDKPEPPYDLVKKSKIVYVLIGLILGTILGMLAVSWKVINRYLGDELNKAIEKASKPKEATALQPQSEPLK
ncbi:MAG TPA: Wzz/FepE/Etk N-terminal domain-containing protein [Ferruginibacter sp.]|nr:Wzz/FepE/Etk N-terminal domain-containing protein [Ferruginibacter sp.]